MLDKKPLFVEDIITCMKKLLLSTLFFTITPLVLFLSIVLLSYFSFQSGRTSLFGNSKNSVAFAALPSGSSQLTDQILTKDARTESLRAFLAKHNSPLEPYSNKLVQASEEHELDYRLIPAIAMQESNLCKKAPKDSNNCWGFGVYGKKVTRFDNYNEAIDSVATTLSKKYKEIGLVTPEEIMSKYTPSNDGEWADSVNFFMNQLY